MSRKEVFFAASSTNYINVRPIMAWLRKEILGHISTVVDRQKRDYQRLDLKIKIMKWVFVFYLFFSFNYFFLEKLTTSMNLEPPKSPSKASLAIYDIEISPDALTSLFVWYSWRVLLTILSWNHISLFWISYVLTWIWPIWQDIMKSIGLCKKPLEFSWNSFGFFPFYFPLWQE